MSEYDDVVQYQRDLLKAEEWAKGIACIHAHGLSSMHYDDRPQDTADGKNVTDYEYNSGIIKRFQQGKLIHTFGEELEGEQLVQKYGSHNR